MTNGKKGQRSRAVHLPLTALALLLPAGPVPALAQENGTPASPSSSRPLDFRLPPADDGRAPGVQGPSDNGLPPVAPGERPGAQPTPAPLPTAPRVIPTQPAPATTAATPAPTAAQRNGPANSSPRNSATADSTTSVSPAAQNNPALPPMQPGAPAIVTPSDAATSVAIDAPAGAGPANAGADTPLWAWALAVLAALGAGLWYWRRRMAVAGPTIDDHVEAPRPVAPPPAQRAVARPSKPVLPSPPPRPAPAPIPPVLRDEPRPASPLVTRPADEQRAIVGMALEILSIRFVPDHVVVAFTLNLLNQGAVAATGLMVRIALNHGSAMPEGVLGRFFDGAGGSVLRDDMTLAPGEGEQLSSEAMLLRSAIDPLMIGGKPVLVPVMAFDVTYHWDGEGEAFGQNAGSFVIGREHGKSGSDKLAPLSLDRATYTVDLPGARSTAVRRAQ